MLKELSIATSWLRTGHNVALALVTKTWGSAPRREGSLMIVHPDGHFEGSVSGGCIEADVVTEASILAKTGGIKPLHYTVGRESAWNVGLACGGEIDILLVALSAEHLDMLENCLKLARDDRHTCQLVINTADTANANIEWHTGGDNISPVVSKAEDTVTLTIKPKPRLIIVGAVHIAKFLCEAAAACGHEVTLIDPRGLFTVGRDFTAAQIIEDWPDEYFEKTPLDSNSALVTLTHDPKLDDAALRHALKTDAYYIGSLGSRKTHAERLDRLRDAFTESDLERIHGPVGLNIGAATPDEIAVSVMAEIIAVVRGANAAR